MNSTTYPRWHRSAGANAVLGFSAVFASLTLLSGCGRRPIIVHSAPPPTPTTVIHTPAPAPAPQPVVGTASREIIVVKEAPPPPRAEPPPPPPPSSSYT